MSIIIEIIQYLVVFIIAFALLKCVIFRNPTNINTGNNNSYKENSNIVRFFDLDITDSEMSKF